MKILTKQEVQEKPDQVLEEMQKGKIFIYPTDTVYGIGCNALIPESVTKIREAKNRMASPFSVIAPNKDWIRENCTISQEAEKWIEKLPGPYTLILNLKNQEATAKEVNQNSGTLGVRIPEHWTTELFSKLEIPFVTTSVNLHGEPPLTSLNELKPEIKDKVDYFIDDGELGGKASTLVNLTSGEKVIER